MQKKRSQTSIVLLLGICLLVTTACAPIPRASDATVTADDILAEMTDGEKNWMDLDQSQYLADYDALYQQLQENYPYFGVAARKVGVDAAQLYEEHRAKIENCRNDVDFYNGLRAFVNEFEYVGHLAIWGYRYESEVSFMQDLVVQFPQYAEQLAPYLEKLDNPVSQQNYQAMEQFYQQVDAVAAERNHTDATITEAPNAVLEGERAANVETKILEEGKIAYLRINAFDMDAYAADRQIILSFLASVRDYPDLVIDITGNPGGGMDYFNQLVVAPLIRETLTVPTYLLIKGGQNNADFLQLTQGLAEGYWHPIAELPVLPKLNAEDLQALDYFAEENYTVAPLDANQAFSGKIWLLVDQDNYSSSEYAAMFAKQSGFATLVGEQTGGDGIGVDPVYIILPNSGFVVQHSPVYGISADGTGSEEYGTKPDIVAKEGQTPLEACLQAIAAANNETV